MSEGVTHVEPTVPASTTVPVATSGTPQPGQTGPMGTSPPAVNPAPAPANPSYEVPLDYEIQVGDERLTIKDAFDAARQLKEIQGSGYDQFKKAMSGDRQAAIEFLSKYGQAPVQTPVQTPQPTAQNPEMQTLMSELAELRNFVRTQQGREVMTGLEQVIKGNPEFSALASRPNAVTEVVEKLNVLRANGTEVNAIVLQNVLKAMNENEKSYQESILKPYREQLGELGLDEPFRGNAAQVLNEPKPDMSKDPKGYKRWLANQFTERVRAARSAGGLGSPSLV